MRYVVMFFTCLAIQLALVGCSSIEGKVSNQMFDVRTGPSRGLPSEQAVLAAVDAWAKRNGFLRRQLNDPRAPKGLVYYGPSAVAVNKEHCGINALYAPKKFGTYDEGKFDKVIISVTGGRYSDAEQKEINRLVEDFRRRTAFRLETLDGKPLHIVIQ